MNAPRITSATTIPTVSAVCCRTRGTANLAMMMMKMNRLSTDREYSVNQPAKNSPPYRGPATADEEVDEQERGGDEHGGPPQPRRNVHSGPPPTQAARPA